MENLAHLQALVQDQISQANEFRQRMDQKLAEFNFKQANEGSSLASRSKSAVDLSHPHLPSISLSTIEMIRSQSTAGLNAREKVRFSEEPRKSLPDIHFGDQLLTSHENSHPQRYSNPEPLKLTIPKPKKKLNSLNSAGSSSLPWSPVDKKRVRTGKVKRVETRQFTVQPENSLDSNYRMSPQLVEDIGEAFKAMHNRRLKPMGHTRFDSTRPISAPHYDPLPQVYESRVRTPPEVIGEDNPYSRSQLLADRFITELDDMDKNFEESCAIDLAMTMSAKELSSMVEKEHSSFDSLALYVETKYIEMKEHEKETGNFPTRLKAAICADLLTKLSYGLGRYAPVMEPLIWELLNSIFCEFPQREKVLTRENYLQELLKLRGYFELYHEARDALEDISSELYMIQQGLQLKDLVKKFQTVRLAFHEDQRFIRDVCFKAWRSLWVRGKRLRRLAKRKALRIRWNAWKRFVKRRHEREMEEYSSELDKKITRLVELNNLITAHNTDESQATPSETRKSMIVFGTASLIDPQLLPSPINTAIKKVYSPVSAQEEGKSRRSLSERKSIIDTITRKVSQNFETVTIATTPSMRRMMSSRIPSVATTAVPSLDIDEKQTNSHALEPTPEEIKAVQRIEEVVKVTAEIANEKSDQMTQTPDEWMLGVNESLLLTELSLSQSFAATTKSFSADYNVAQSESRDSIDLTAGAIHVSGAPQRRGSIAKYQLNAMTANQLIAFIYENRYAEIIKEPLRGNFGASYPLLQYTKRLLLQRYSLRRLAQKFYRGLIACCLRESVQNKRLELFGILSGIPLADKIDSQYDADRCTFFFRILKIFFRHRIDYLANTFATKEIDRAVVLSFMPDIFEELKEKDLEFYQNIIYDIVDLPALDPDVIDRVYKVDIDEVLAIMMDAYEVKYRKIPEDVDETRIVTASKTAERI